MDTKHLFVGKKILTAVFVFFFSIFGIQSSYADYYPSGIQQNVSEQTLRNNGWTLFYEQTYATSHGSNASSLRPSGEYVILTGKAVGSSTLPVLAAAPTSQVFTETATNTPQLLNGTYWYNTPTLSIGFAPTSVIDQHQADSYEAIGYRTSPTNNTTYSSPSSPLRLSWHLINDNSGGWRLGDQIDLNSSTAYLKQVWTWNGVSTANVRRSSNLTFAQSLYASDTLSDEDGELRKTVDQIMNKYGSLIK
jgi:hypothetical protein